VTSSTAEPRVPAGQPRVPPPVPPPLALRNVGYAYEDGPDVLDGLSIEIVHGRKLALLGPNGSGKTTLLRLLTGGLRPSRGTLLLDGTAVRHDRRGLGALRRTVQLVLQDPDDQLFSASVGQDVSFGPLNLGLAGPEVRRRVDEALVALDVAAIRDRPTHLLSYGQRKRVAIAGAVAMRPRILVLDEPTAGLDPSGVEALLGTLHELRAAGTTLVMATHDVDLAYRWADDAAILAGEALHTGPADEVLADHDLLRRASLRPAWAPSAGEILAAHGLLPAATAGRYPATPQELAAAAPPPPDHSPK
jgi:cobalt/nickel transport system ATP-binding protein